MSTLLLYEHSVFNNSYFKLQEIVNKGYSMNITAELKPLPINRRLCADYPSLY